VDRGVYVLILYLPSDRTINVGKLGEINFKKGFYAYVGSALNGLRARILRHVRRQKKFHWHIDYLSVLSIPQMAIIAKTDERMECPIARELANNFFYVKNFGSTDCDCKSHLFYSKDRETLLKVVKKAFIKLGLNPELLRVVGSEFKLRTSISN